MSNDPPLGTPPAQPAQSRTRRGAYQINLEEVNLGFINDTVGIGVGHEWLFVPVEHVIRRRAADTMWRVRIRDLRTPPITECAWVSVRDIQLLATQSVARQFRSCLEAEFGNWRIALDYLILRIQENEGRFLQQGPQEEGDEDEEGGVHQFRVELSTQELEEVENILNSPNALQMIGTHLDNLSAGETNNKRTIFVVLLGGKSPSPKMKQMLLLRGTPGAGKTVLMEISDLFRYKEVGRFTKRALDYSAESFRGIEVLKLKELGDMDQEDDGLSTIKFLSSDDNGYNVEYVIRDEATGRMRTETQHIPPLTIISSTNRVDVDSQFQRRNWIINPDESPEQTERVREWMANENRELNYVALGILAETSKQRSKRILMGLLDRIPPCEVIVPFADALTSILEANSIRVRGDYRKLITLVKLYGILIQRSLPNVIREDGSLVVIMTPERAIDILQLALEPLTTMTSSLGRSETQMLQYLEDHYCDVKGAAISKSMRDDMANSFKRSTDLIRRNLNLMESAGYLSSEERGHNDKVWTLLYNLPEIRRKMSSVSDKLGQPRGIIEKMWNETIAWARAIADANPPVEATPAEAQQPPEQERSEEVATNRLVVSQSLSDAFRALIPGLTQMRDAQLQVLASAEETQPPEPERPEVQIQAQIGGETLGGTGTLTGTLMERLNAICQFVASESLVVEAVDEEQIAGHFNAPMGEVTRLLEMIRRDSGAPIFSPRPAKWRSKS